MAYEYWWGDGSEYDGYEYGEYEEEWEGDEEGWDEWGEGAWDGEDWGDAAWEEWEKQWREWRPPPAENKWPTVKKWNVLINAPTPAKSSKVQQGSESSAAAAEPPLPAAPAQPASTVPAPAQPASSAPAPVQPAQLQEPVPKVEVAAHSQGTSTSARRGEHRQDGGSSGGSGRRRGRERSSSRRASRSPRRHRRDRHAAPPRCAAVLVPRDVVDGLAGRPMPFMDGTSGGGVLHGPPPGLLAGLEPLEPPPGIF